MADSTKKIGDTFEDYVLSLLRAANIEAKRNEILPSQQVDIFAVRRDLGKEIRSAIECKARADVLTKDEVANLFVKYDACFEANEIDEIILITIKGITGTAANFVRSKRKIRHLTIAELQAQLMDFTSYVNSLIRGCEDDGLDDFYVPLRARAVSDDGSNNFSPDFDLAETVSRWICADESPPLAILSSYGTGKTTFVRHTAARLAKEFKADPTNRIPIVLDLGSISDEQSLEGLLGKSLTTGNSVRNYSFELFLELNRAGRFVIFLDSLDEMKHGITWPSFLRNMDQIKRLIHGQSRVVMLGRPSIFMTDAEKQEALNDKFLTGGRWIRDAHFAEFRELNLCQFDQAQIRLFVNRYTSFLVKRGCIRRANEKRILERLEDSEAKGIWDLAQRPVQLQMITQVLPEWNEPLEKLDRVLLYGSFVDLIIRRECKKLSRDRIGASERRAFARGLAWHLGGSTLQQLIRTQDIPDELFTRTLGKSKSTLQTLRRELIVGCALEFKPPDIVYFPHRSIQEFLIAEHIKEELANESFDPISALSSATAETRDFFRAMEPVDELLRAAHRIVSDNKALPDILIELFSNTPRLLEYISAMARPGVASNWPGVFLVFQDATTNRYREHERLLAVGTASYVHYGIHLLLCSSYGPDSGSEGVRRFRHSFFWELEKIVAMQSHSQWGREATQALGNLLQQIAIVGKKKTFRAELGGIRSALSRHYLATQHLRPMFVRQRLTGPFDFEVTVPLTESMATQFRSLRDKLVGIT